jgi:hypothetical protein
MNLCDIATVTHGLKDFWPIKLTFISKQGLFDLAETMAWHDKQKAVQNK